mmetsp:Transcript_9368/g.28925  ORF Transcript_9368/g.28925 Transcript_9368/m.28925 type:complete len:85 (-) Transcript_9368:259-513(-)
MAASTLSTKRKLVDRAAKIEPLRVASAPFCSSHTEPQTEVDVAPSKRVLVIPGTDLAPEESALQEEQELARELWVNSAPLGLFL